MRKVLEVPYYSEFESIDSSNNHIEVFKRRSCGIVSLKMVLDYWAGKTGESKIKLETLIEVALKHHAYRLQLGRRKNYGWIHAGLIRTIQDFGFLSWRHRFFIKESDLNHLGRENHSKKSLNAYKRQVVEEAMHIFSKSIDNSEPFLVSINKNMGKKVSPHLVVVTGYESENGRISGLYIHDPNNPKKNGKRTELVNQFINRKDFVKMWRKTAIFIKK